MENEVTIDDLSAADQAVREARADFRQCGLNVRAARAELARALAQWNAGAPTISWEENAAQFRASETAERQRRAEAGAYRRPATVSETAKAIGIGGHRSQRGGGTSYRRGAFSKAQAMEVNALRLRAERAAAKLPSDR